ncbi:variant erythrocyte surface antigen-1 family protein [Babesia caballi]|uniref:Variant erythrocyte surface antigen-1 family protein n=1 Tax=Babesia caballi TaxID=5871 RepID=A0AAV4LT96_BABCB|nr:variant erythrocyte surface antigen-1 family protein [Babesia caballi]
MGDQKKSKLTEWPENLKEVIDWFLRVGGKDQDGSGYSNSGKLETAVKSLNGFTDAAQGLGTFYIEGLFKKVAEGLQQLIGYNSMYQLEGNGIGRKQSSPYTSSYSIQAKWESSLNTATSSEAQKAANIFLGSMPILYFGLTYLLWRCSGKHGWQDQRLQGDSEISELSDFMNVMGYDTNKLNSGVNGQTIAKLLGTDGDSIQDLKELYSSVSTMTYPEFLKQMNQNGKDKLSHKQAANAPLYVLYAASNAYLTTKLSYLKNKELPQTQSDIAKTLNWYSEAVNKLDASNTRELSTAYNTLLSQIKDVFPDPPVPPSSSGAAAAGGVLGTAAIGGTAAAFATNVGGITTTLKSFIPIFK